MTLDELLWHYNEGHFNNLGIALRALQIVDAGSLDHVLSSLPKDVLDRLAEFVTNYNPKIAIWNGPIPSAGVVQLAKEWLAKSNTNLVIGEAPQNHQVHG